jgi:hypothetical protein
MAQSRPRDQSRTTVAIARTTEIGEPAAKLPNHRPPNGKPNALPTAAASAAQRFGLGSCRVHARDHGGMGALRRGGDAAYLRGEPGAAARANFHRAFGGAGNLLRENMQAFLDQSVRIAESASRMATRPGGIEGGEYRAAAKASCSPVIYFSPERVHAAKTRRLAS